MENKGQEPKILVATADPDAQRKKEEEDRILALQKKLLPWIIGMPTALIAAFIFLSTIQLRHIEDFVYQNSGLILKKELPTPGSLNIDSIDGKMSYLKLYSLASMEEISMNRRYNAAGASMMSAIYTRYLGFFTGMILAIVGAVFIISKFRERVTNIDMSLAEQMKFRLASSSPGIVFGFLGTVLMIVTIVKKTDFEVKDSPLYLNYTTLPSDRIIGDSTLNRKAINSLGEGRPVKDPRHINPDSAKDAHP
jgi:hypothetical protein